MSSRARLDPAFAPYEWVQVIGTGAYGTVYRARSPTGESVAIKKIRIATSEEGMPMAMIREVSMLKSLEHFEHPNIVRLKDVFHGAQRANELRLMLVFEYIDQDLAQYLERCPDPGLGPDLIRNFMQQMLSGIDFLHSHRIVHRDLKPQNILVTNSKVLKLADFGLARIYSFQMLLTSVVVTLWYRPPEVLLQDSYASAVDLWSCGCIFAELFTRRPLFKGQSEVDQLYKIFNIIGTPDETDWPTDVSIPWTSFPRQFKESWPIVIPGIEAQAADLMEQLLTFDQHKRITASNALDHPYFSEVCPYADQAIHMQDEYPFSRLATTRAIVPGRGRFTSLRDTLAPTSVSYTTPGSDDSWWFDVPNSPSMLSQPSPGQQSSAGLHHATGQQPSPGHHHMPTPLTQQSPTTHRSLGQPSQPYQQQRPSYQPGQQTSPFSQQYAHVPRHTMQDSQDTGIGSGMESDMDLMEHHETLPEESDSD